MILCAQQTADVSNAHQQRQLQQQEQQRAFAALKAAAPVCSAQLQVQQGGNGLAASTRIEAGQTVLQLPNHNALIVLKQGRCQAINLPC